MAIPPCTRLKELWTTFRRRDSCILLRVADTPPIAMDTVAILTPLLSLILSLPNISATSTPTALAIQSIIPSIAATVSSSSLVCLQSFERSETQPRQQHLLLYIIVFNGSIGLDSFYIKLLLQRFKHTLKIYTVFYITTTGGGGEYSQDIIGEN
jgi:hypothetical protein